MLFEINHRTLYNYTAPVSLEPMTLQLRPRSDVNQTVRDFRVEITPSPAGLSHCVGLDGNNTDTVWFDRLYETLQIDVYALVETHPDDPFNFLITDTAALTLPLKYETSLQVSLAHYLHSASNSPELTAFTQEMMQSAKFETISFLMLLAQQIPTRLKYMLREHGDPWTPQETLQHGEGACRDFSILFIEACRIAGIAARFVSGYCIGNEADNSHMHAWAEVYLPGAGWRGFDPSRGVTTSEDHISVAAGYNEKDAAPTSGAYRGDAVSSMEADISIRTPQERQT